MITLEALELRVKALEDAVFQVDPSWLKIAKGEVGVKEIVGPQHNPRVLEYHDFTKLNASTDEVAWCSAFMNWVMNKAGYRGTNDAAARSWLTYGKKLTAFKRGCIVVFWRGSKDGWQGHVALGLSEEPSRLFCLGGNQNNSVSEEWLGKEKVLGYFWPQDSDLLPINTTVA